MAEVGRAMLADLDAWDEVPQDRWQFVAAIPRFYNSGDYRLRPEESPGITNRARGGASNGKRRGTEGNANALRGFLAELEAEGGYIAVTGETGAGDGDGEGDSADAPAARGSAGGPDQGKVRPSFFPRRDEVRFFLPFATLSEFSGRAVGGDPLF
jgi:hypothetical protein